MPLRAGAEPCQQQQDAPAQLRHAEARFGHEAGTRKRNCRFGIARVERHHRQGRPRYDRLGVGGIRIAVAQGRLQLLDSGLSV